MKYLLSYILLIFICVNRSYAQSIDEIYELIDNNNVSLRTYAARCNAAKLEAHTGITLADPEVEFGYLWGTPNEIGDRKDFAVTQSIDFATILGSKRREARSKDELADLEYQQARSLLHFTAQQLIIDITYLNKRIAEQENRLSVSARMIDAYEKLIHAGEIDKFELNRVRLRNVSLESDYQRLIIEKESLMKQLQSMCGDQSSSIAYKSIEYPISYLSGNALSQIIINKEAEIASNQLKTARHEGLPELKAGYMSELTKEEKFRGITVGMSIPLWKNKNNVSKAKAQQILAEANCEEEAVKIANQQQVLLAKTTRLLSLHESLLNSLRNLDPSQSLQKALSAGEISIVNVLNDIEMFYELFDKTLETEHDYQQSLAEYSFLQVYCK